ncbi:Uncharacterized protein dnm_080600 [Desulfonema magnum]|uniref:Uncharacterized protein n=1 Tax=Desulfonema magnum TaxID=45655 RepID=A0A975BV92_9BACT|nr:Uncharacterized protein dnm_080600 [Desulfonema magnum]
MSDGMTGFCQNRLRKFDHRVSEKKRGTKATSKNESPSL